MVVLLSLLLVHASAILENNPFVIKTNDAAVLKASEDPAFFTIGLMYTEDMQTSKAFEEIITAITNRYKDFIIVHGVDCTDDYETCPDSRRRLLPTTSGWSLSNYNEEGKPVVHNTNYSGTVSVSEMARWVEEHLPFLGVKLTTSNLESFLAHEANKVILFSSRETAPNVYKGLSSYFKGKLAFGFVNKEESELVSRYHVTSFPTLLVVDGSSSVLEYEGVLDYIPTKNFLANYASRAPLGPPLMDVNVFHEPELFDPKMFEEEWVGPKNFTSVIESKQQLSLVHFYKGETHDNWKPSVERYQGLVFLANFDCSDAESLSFAKTLGIKRFPSVRLFKTPTKNTELTFDSVADLDELVSSRLEAPYTTVSDLTIENWITETIDADQQGILLLSNEDITVQYLSLVSHFKDDFAFGYYRKNNKAMLKSLRARRYPTLLMYTKTANNTLQTVEYESDLASYPLMYFFLDSIVKQRGKPITSLEQQTIELEQVPEYYSKNFDDLCGRKSGVCVIGFINGNAFDAKHAALLSELKKAKVEARTNKSLVRVGWLDANCEYELRDFVGLTDDQLPSLVLYLPVRRRLAIADGEITSENIKAQLKRLQAGELITKDVADIKFADRDCSLEQPMVKKHPRHTEL
mmetsp:Transcript_6668/g.11800  ORF Transcript_6668/g.11800 Transcript_6668/m.11800 type:complete len:635 (-) Transcript_6668:1114-3018(-)|eukprot:CAMPEP_0204900848 /NCGR_PEP_ID=MMETSP1397-20131031/2715_1 /ASSEMBLY_ACC=CAM_ASM_000891 /TAXON_ID=49980 /ORGANISM="Climacostomum Climacostomum virens, Strain Stock W-24" /LENGTH=634 /DNA_ID=CAMNT_0052069077 /DNA_START=146 /DNA_END=2050 /DNA_ORIENTATION=+